MKNKTFKRIAVILLEVGILVGSYGLGFFLSDIVESRELIWLTLICIPFMGMASVFAIMDVTLKSGLFDEEEEKYNERNKNSHRRRPAASRNYGVQRRRSGKTA